MSPEELQRRFEAAQGGDDRSWAALVAVLQPRLERYVRRHTGPGTDVEALVQEVWLRLVRTTRGPAPASPRSIVAWIFRTARNTRIDRLRKASLSARPASALPGRGLDGVAAPGRTPSLQVRDQEAIELARGVYESLPAEQREVLRLVDADGLDRRTAAQRLLKSPEATKKLYQRALAAFVQRLRAKNG